MSGNDDELSKEDLESLVRRLRHENKLLIEQSKSDLLLIAEQTRAASIWRDLYHNGNNV